MTSPRTHRAIAIMFASAASLTLFSAGRVARAEDVKTFELVLQNDAFTPSDLKVPANKPFILKVSNRESAGVEIEAKDLKIEKIVAAGGDVITHVRAMKPGKYLLVNEYKEETVKTYVTVE
jgi:hypothetical protein